MGHVIDAMLQLERMTASGSLPSDVALEAEMIAAEWWWNARGDFTPDRLVLLVGELQRWCTAAARHYALRWAALTRAGLLREAQDAARWAQALGQAGHVLRVYA